MRQYYFATKATEHALRSALNNELGIYHTQTGAGIGGFFKGLFKKIIPIGKSLIKQGFEADYYIKQGFEHISFFSVIQLFGLYSH